MITTPIPERMAHLPCDHRGYPIPWMVYRDLEDRPHFQINDHVKRMISIDYDLCSICGKKLFRGRWFVGGPMSAYDENGAYIDPPMHDECVHYALKVCPYLAAPRYAHEIGTRTLGKHDRNTLVLTDPTMIDGRPELFVAVMAIGQTLTPGNEYVRPKRPYRAIEWWRHGKRLLEA